ncbi:MAG: hypothetical protein LUC86_07495 [Prevotellaceae bacterium]|nr:hypothetical protein [Prevotellaceae bacterium]
MRRFASLTLLSTLCATLYAQETQESFSDTPSSVTEEADAAPISLSTELPSLHSSVPGVPSSASRPYAAYAQPEAQATYHTSRYVAKGGHRGFDFGVDMGFLAYTGEGGGGCFAPEISAGKRFSKNIYAGVAFGPELPFNGGNTTCMVAGDFRFYVPLQNPRFAPGGMVRVGYDTDFGDYVSCAVLQVMPTFQFAITKTVDANVGVGYTEYFNDPANFGAVVMKVGFGFHMPSDKQIASPRWPKKPVIENGIQLTLEGDVLALGNISSAGGFALAATYKYDPHISFGLGFGFDAGSLGNNKCIVEETSSETKKRELSGSIKCERLFLRGAYRVFDKRHSPLVACDLGVFFLSDCSAGGWSFDTVNERFHKNGVYVTPSVGYSLRTTTNSLLVIKVGYSVSSSATYKNVVEDKYSKTTYGKLPLTALYASVGYTHTFQWGQNWRKKH